MMSFFLRTFEGHAVHRCLASNISLGARTFESLRFNMNLHRFLRRRFEKVLSYGGKSELGTYRKTKTFKFFDSSNLEPMLKQHPFLRAFDSSKSSRVVSICVPIESLRLCCIYSYLRKPSKLVSICVKKMSMLSNLKT